VLDRVKRVRHSLTPSPPRHARAGLSLTAARADCSQPRVAAVAPADVSQC
jgi:hypothetical protein